MVLPQLTPTQDHFLKKYYLERELETELHVLGQSGSLAKIGHPFKPNQDEVDQTDEKLPMLTFFFKHFLENFPFITNNPEKDQLVFWQDTVQPFMDSFNQKNISDSLERKEHVTKRKQVNTRFLHGMLLFYNSMLVSEQDLAYLEQDHLKPSDTGKLDKLQKGQAKGFQSASATINDDYSMLSYVNDINVNVVAVRRVNDALDGANTSDSLYRTNTGSSVSSSPKKLLWNPFTMMTTQDTPRHNYEFIVEVVKRTKSLGEYSYNSHYVSKPYHAFKELQSHLKKKLPGLMATDVPKLPQKMKHDNGVESEKAPNLILFREKLRLALRGWLHTLMKHSEIVYSNEFNDFISKEEDVFTELPELDIIDRKQRAEHERSLVQAQIEFQSQTAKVVYGLSQDFENFKEELIANPESLSEMFGELSKSDSIKDLSPLLQTFLEWCKLEVAATLYQVFLGQDNSSEWLIKCQKFHRLFPYNMIYGILKYTNPIKVVSRVVDLLLVNFPSFSVSMPWSKAPDKLQLASKKSGANNLLSMMFVMLLDEDLSDFEKELKKLKLHECLQEPRMLKVLEKIENYVNCEDVDLIDSIKEIAIKDDADLLITILESNSLEPELDVQALEMISSSYKYYNSLEDHGKLDNSELYLLIKQYWQVLIRRRDKDLMKQLWQEPELTQLIKKFLTIFYQPLMRVFKKCDIHLVFKDFERFMDDLMQELNKLSDGEIFFMSAIEIFNKFKAILDRHEIVLWRFIHDLYVKDDQQLFIKLIKWVEDMLKILRMKYIDESKVMIVLQELQPEDDSQFNAELFMQQLQQRIDSVLEKRKLLKDYIEEEATLDEKLKVDKNWDQVNNDIFKNTDGHEFGIDANEIEEFNLMQKHESQLKQNLANLKHKDLYARIAKIDSEMNKLATDELDKLRPSFSKKLEALLLLY